MLFGGCPHVILRHGPVWLMNHAKVHFQTTDKVLSACGKSREDIPPEGQVVKDPEAFSKFARK